MFERLLSRLGVAASALVALVLAHELVFLVSYGPAYSAALAATGHDGSWTFAVAVVATLGACLLVAASWRLRSLGLRARDLGRFARAARGGVGPRGAAEPKLERPTVFLARWTRSWTWLAASTAILFTVQENVEHLRIGQAAPGLGALLHDGTPLPILLILAATLAVAFVVALFGWRRAVLVARIRRHLSRRRRAVTIVFPPFERAERGPRALFERALAVRAPPVAAGI